MAVLIAAALVAFTTFAVPLPAVGQQVPSSATREQALRVLQQRPDLVRQGLQQSGLTEAQVRQRLQAAGLPPSLLDQFLGPGEAAGAAVTADVLGALSLLGVTPITPEGVDSLPLIIGPQPGRIAAPSRVFGVDVFRGRTTQFHPQLTGPVPDAYRIGPGDLLVLVLTGDVELVHQLEVNREGFMVIPLVGQLYVANLTMGALRTLLRQRLARSYSGIPRGTTHFDVTIARLRTIQVFVIGEVAQPGAYQLSSVATVLNALYVAGGPSERGTFREVRIDRRGARLGTLDVYDYLLGGSTASDVVLEQGDVVFVPIRATQASIVGAVVRPATYEMKSGQTLADLVRMAGGFQADAQLQRVAVHRILPPSEHGPAPAPRAVIDVPLQANDQEAGPPPDAMDGVVLPVRVPGLKLENGDSVVVNSILPRERSLFITITGMVNQPGQFPWREGVSLRDLVLLARGPQVGADLREAEIARLPADRSDGSLAETFRVPLDSSYLFERDSLGRYLGPPGLSFPGAGSAPEVVLQPYDQVTVFKQPEFEFQRTVWVTGEVPFPGAFALERKDERLSDLVGRAGGLLRTAYPGGARFYRSLDETGRVNVDLAGVLAKPGAAEDLILQPGDSLHLPEFIPVVRVTGQVNSPTSVRYERGKGFGFYLANAGGYSSEADKGRASVRYADGSARVRSRFLFFTSYPEPGPGSTIVVPTRPPDRGGGIDIAVLLGGIVQAASALTTMILVIDRLANP